MTEKNSFIMYNSWARLISGLTDEQAGSLIKAICSKELEEDYTIEDTTISAIFGMISEQLDKDSNKYDETREARAKAGKKGMKSRWVDNKDTENITNDNSVKQNITNITDTVSDSESESESDSVSENEHPTGAKKKKSAQARPARHKHGEFGHVLLTDDDLARLNGKHGEDATQAAIKAVDEYCEQSGKTYKNYALVMEKWGYRSVAENARSGTTKGGYVDAISHRFDAISDWLEESNDT